jgi:hypothetical protein
MPRNRPAHRPFRKYQQRGIDMAERTVFNVFTDDIAGWHVQRRGDTHELSRHDTRDDAIAEAKRVAMLEAPSEIRVTEADGTSKVEYIFDEDRQLVLGPG